MKSREIEGRAIRSMALYKVLLVDDEEDVRQSIVKKLDWAALGFELAGEAGNGLEALEVAERLRPDVIMTDIKMPFMDGLEFCRRVRSILPGVRLAIFSGFGEFDYAKEAISQQVEEYILKPVNAQELAEVFVRMRRSLDDEIDARRNLDQLRQHYRESYPLMRQQLLQNLLEGKRVASASVEQLAEYHIDLAAKKYAVALLRYDMGNMDGEEAALMAVSLGQLVRDALADKIRCEIIQMPDRFALLCMLEERARTLRTQLDQLFPLSKKLLGMQISIGLSRAYSDPDNISACYREAEDALEYQLIMDPEQCVYIGDIEPMATGALPEDHYIAELLRQIKVGEEEALRQAVEALITAVKEGGLNAQQCQIYLLELFTELLKLIRSYDMDEEKAGQSRLIEGIASMRFSHLDELGEWLFAFCDNLRQLATRERKDSARMLVDRAKELIGERYADSGLSLDTLCAQLNVSPAYFSSLFKKETGQGFVNYLTGLRMEKALELLRSTDDKTYQIAEKIGYADPNYFSYVFKKQFGASPSKYRGEKRSEHEKGRETDASAG